MLLTRKFWLRTADRAVRAAAYGALGVLGGGQLNAWDVDWKKVVGFALGMAILSTLGSLAASNVGDRESPSLVP